MKITVVPLTSFVHGNIDAHEGKPFNCEKGLADEFERAGLVRVKRAPVQPNTTPATAVPQAGNATAAGAGQQSSASPAAPVSPTTTSTSSSAGATKPPPKKPAKSGA